MKHFFSSLLLFFFLTNSIIAQTSDTSNMVTVQTKSDKFYIGELINITPDSIYMITDDSVSMVFDKKNVKTIHNGILPLGFMGTPNSSVPYYVQTALPNGSGNHYYKNYYIFGNEFNFGLSDQFNLSLGFESASLLFDNGPRLPLMQIGAKYSIPTSDIVHIGMSSKYYFNDEGSAFMASVPITFGRSRTNFTVAPNFVGSDEDKYIGIFSNLSLALSYKTRFIIDFVHIDNTTLFAPNFEFVFKNGFSLTIGGIINSEGSAPSLSFSIPFGKWKKKR